MMRYINRVQSSKFKVQSFKIRSNMKRVFLMIISALVCGAMFTGCYSEKTEPKKTAGELYVFGVKSGTVSETDLVFKGDDIISFNARYGEIVFTASKFEEIISRLTLHTELQFFIGDNLVFNPPIRIYYGWGISNDDCDLQFRTNGVKTYLTDMYMHVDSLLSQIDREILEKAMEINKQKRKAELDVLINYLSDMGKITERIAPLPEDNENSLSNCDKYVLVDDTLYVNTPFIADLEILEMKIEDNHLKIKFSATGCDFGNSWNINLIDWGLYAEINPGFRLLKLIIDNKGDCSTWRITREVCFNIENLQIQETNQIQLNVSGNWIFYEY